MDYKYLGVLLIFVAVIYFATNDKGKAKNKEVKVANNFPDFKSDVEWAVRYIKHHPNQKYWQLLNKHIDAIEYKPIKHPKYKNAIATIAGRRILFVKKWLAYIPNQPHRGQRCVGSIIHELGHAIYPNDGHGKKFHAFYSKAMKKLGLPVYTYGKV